MKHGLLTGYQPFSFILSCIDKTKSLSSPSFAKLQNEKRHFKLRNYHFLFCTGDRFWRVSNPLTLYPPIFEWRRYWPYLHLKKKKKKAFQWIFSYGWESPEKVISNRSWEAARKMMDAENFSFRLPRLQTASDSGDLHISPFWCRKSQLIFRCLFVDQLAGFCRALRPSLCTVT